MSRRYISIAEAAKYLKISDRTVRRLIADGELTGYFIGRGHRMLRVDLDEIDGKLMRPIGFHRNDPTAKPRERERPRVPDRSAAVKRLDESAKVKKASERKPRRQTLWCRCGHGDGAHGMRTTYGPGVDPPHPRFKCWSCECKEFVEDVERPRRNRIASDGVQVRALRRDSGESASRPRASGRIDLAAIGDCDPGADDGAVRRKT